jgi:hypothetical protein
MSSTDSSPGVLTPCSTMIQTASGRVPYSENTVHLLMCVECPVFSLKTLQPYTAALGGVYTEHGQFCF